MDIVLPLLCRCESGLFIIHICKLAPAAIFDVWCDLNKCGKVIKFEVEFMFKLAVIN